MAGDAGGSQTGGGTPRIGGISLHLVPEPAWHKQAAGDTYVPERFAEEGFVHTTLGEETLLEVANRYYRDDPRPYLVLDVDLDRLAAPVRFDEAGPSYPHVYGPIETTAVVRVRRADRDPAGAFVGIGANAVGPLGA